MTFIFRDEQSLNGQISFIRGDKYKTRKKYSSFFQRKKQNEKNDEKSVTLQEDNLFFDALLKLLPRYFTLTTNNSSSLFNIDLLMNTSSVIAQFHKENPNIMEYHIDIDDKDNILQKFEKLYQGYNVAFDEDELPTSKKITSLLNITRCPNYMKPEILRTNEYMFLSKGLEDGVEIDQISLESFINQLSNQTFKIITNNNEYLCNSFTIFSSQIIRNLILDDPTTYQFKYDYDDENNEFQLICDYFNFKTIKITSNNIDILTEICEDLKIESILPKIENFLNEYMKKSETIDEQQNTVDLIEELFDLLYNIQKYSVDSVKSSIMKSTWIKTEDNVIEFAAFLIQVINNSIKLHPYLLDLLIKLDEEAKDSNKLNILLQFVINNLFQNFGENFANCSFVFNLYKKGFISKEMLSENFKDYRIIYLISWFLPEIIELKSESIISDLIQKEKSYFKCQINFIKSYFPDKIDLYIKMRDKGEPEDELTKALRIDDIDKVQLILSKTNFDFSKYTIPYNIFDDFKENGKMKLIDYAAAYGSIKCFKYLFLNDSNNVSMKYAIYGGNTEIIKIVDQNSTNEKDIYDIQCAIKTHQNDLFDWILEQKYSKNLQEHSEFLLFHSASNGNAYSFIEIIDKLDSFDYMKMINAAAKNGFYKLLQLIYNIISKSSKVLQQDQNKKGSEFSPSIYFKNINDKINIDFQINSNFSYFGNLAIFKFGLNLIKNNSNIDDALITCINKEHKNIFDYFFYEYDKEKILTFSILKLVKEAIQCKSNYYFNYLADKIKFEKEPFNGKSDFFFDLINTAYQTGYLEKVQLACNCIKKFIKNYNITRSLIRIRDVNICKYFLNEKDFLIDSNDLLSNISTIASFNIDVFSMMIDNLDPELSDSILFYSLNDAIFNRNKDVIKYLLNKNVQYDDALINAVKTHNLEIVNIILDHDSSPSFINKISNEGTALFIAASNTNFDIFQRLLSLPGIDPSLYGDGDQTPLEIAIYKFNLDIVNAILNFFGDEIQSQKWQLNNAIKSALNVLSTYRKGTSIFVDRQKKILPILKRILEIKDIDPNSRGVEHTLLSYACEANEINIVKMLLQTELIDVNAYAPKNGNTPLMIAIDNKNIKIAELLINDKRTNINAKNFESMTALTFAVKQNLEDIVSLLIKNERFNAKLSCIDYAFFISSSLQISNLLLTINSLNVNYVHVKQKNTFWGKKAKHIFDLYLCDTTLFKSITNNDKEKIKLIINHPSFDKDKSQIIRCIFEAININDIEIFKELLKLVDNDVNIVNNCQTSLLIAAIYNSSDSIVEEILKSDKFDTKTNNIMKAFKKCFLNNNFSSTIADLLYKFDSNHEHLIDLNKNLPNGESYFLLKQNKRDLHDKYIPRESLIRTEFLLKNGADPNLPDKNGFYPLEYAIKEHDINLISLFLKSNKIDLNQKLFLGNKKSLFTNADSNSKRTTYLHLAAMESKDSILQLFLLNDSININAEDDLGNTPLMDACLMKNENNIIKLFDFQGQELDYMHRNKNGDDALSLIGVSDKPNLSKSEYKQALLSNLKKYKHKF